MAMCVHRVVLDRLTLLSDLVVAGPALMTFGLGSVTDTQAANLTLDWTV